MDDTLREIFNGDYDITPERDKEQRDLGKKLCVELDKIRSMFGDEFMERLLDLEGELEEWRDFHYYRAGFRLGVRLMLEALKA